MHLVTCAEAQNSVTMVGYQDAVFLCCTPYPHLFRKAVNSCITLSLEIDENAVSPCTLLTPHREVVTMSFDSLTIVGSIAHLNVRLKFSMQAPNLHSPMGSARTPKQHAENLNFPINR